MYQAPLKKTITDFLNLKLAVVVENGTQKRRKKFDIPAGMSITVEDLEKMKSKENEPHKKLLTKKVAKNARKRVLQ